jgi:outer membrane protein assembly factor BamB
VELSSKSGESERSEMKKLILIAVVSLITFSFVTVHADWPQYLGPDRNGHSPEKALAKSWPKKGPKVLWTQPMGKGFAGVAIRDGKVYVLDRVDSKTDVLRCFDLANGNELWTYSNDDPGEFSFNGSRTAPTVEDENIYCVGGMGSVYCISRSSHKPVWKRDLKKDFDAEKPNWGFTQSPLIHKNLVIVAPQVKKAGAVAYDKATGKIVWKTPRLCNDPGYSSPVLTTIDGIDQIVLTTPLKEPEEEEEEEEEEDEDPDEEEDEGPPFEGGGVYGIDVKTGEILWNYTNWKCPISIPPVTFIGDGRMFITGEYGSGSAMIKVARKGGKFEAIELFKTDVCGAQIHPALLYENHLYMNSNGNERRDGLLCLTLDGKVLWRTRKRPSFGRGGLILADGIIYIVEGDKRHLYMVKATPEKYTELGRVKKILKGKEMWAPLALADGKLVIRDQKQLKCLVVK